MRTPLRPVLGALAVGGLSLATAHAQTATLQYLDVLPQIPTSGLAGTGSFSGDLTGIYQLDVLATGEGLVLTDPLYLFCTELQENAPLAPQLYSLVFAAQASANSGPPNDLSANIPVTGIGAARARNLQLLYGSVFGGTTASAYTPLTTLGTDEQRAAFQLAVWELSHGDDFNLSGAGFDFAVSSAPAGAIAQAQAWIDAVKTKVDANDFSGQMLLGALHSDEFQDYLIPLGNGVVVPETSTYAIWFGAGALVIAGLRRRRSEAAG